MVLLLATSFNLAGGFPLLSEEPIIETKFIDINGNLTPIIQETKDLSEFFDLLSEMRTKKSLSIVGKDEKYIYLLVSDNGTDGLTQNNNQVVEGEDKVRTKRSASLLLKKLSDGLFLIGPTAIRSLAVPISLFNYLGYLPMRLPGVPYHVDSGSPDKHPYDIINRFYQ